MAFEGCVEDTISIHALREEGDQTLHFPAYNPV